MKKVNNLKLAIFILSFISVVVSCKKTTQQDQEHLVDQDKIEKSIELFKKKLAQEDKYFIVANNIKTESYAIDENEKRLSSREIRNLASARGMSTCDDENGDPIYGFDESVLESCSVSYLCGSGYKVSTSWLITTPLPLTATNSKGRVRLKNSSGTIVHTNTNITPVSITTLSQTNPNFPSSNVYRVTYLSPYINQTTFQSATLLENGVLLATSCSQGPQAVSYLTSYALNVTNMISSPCKRIDPVYVNAPAGGYVGNIAGCDAVGTCSNIGYVHPNYQEVEFIPISGGAVAKTSTIRYWDVKTVIPITPPAALPADNTMSVYVYKGTYTIRFRNSHSCSPAAPWSPTIGYNVTY